MTKKKKSKVHNFIDYLLKKTKKDKIEEVCPPEEKGTNFLHWFNGDEEYLRFNDFIIEDKNTLKFFHHFLEKIQSTEAIVGLYDDFENEEGSGIDFVVAVDGTSIDFGYSLFTDGTIVATINTFSPAEGPIEYCYKSVPNFKGFKK